MTSNIISLLEANKDVFENEHTFTKDDRKSFLESVKAYSNYGQVIYRSADLKEAIAKIESIINVAKGMTLKETEGWFDNITTSRHMKQLEECYKTMKTEASEIMQRQQRLESAYEDIGQLLEKYYDI